MKPAEIRKQIEKCIICGREFEKYTSKHSQRPNRFKDKRRKNSVTCSSGCARTYDIIYKRLIRKFSQSHNFKLGIKKGWQEALEEIEKLIIETEREVELDDINGLKRVALKIQELKNDVA